MDRFRFGRLCKGLFHLHYDVRAEGDELLHDGKVHLVLPNHSAYIDPLLLMSEEWDVALRPMTDELFMRHPVYGRILRMADAIEVPDLQKSSMSREEGAAAASQLSRIAIESLAAGKEVLFYPSGHVKKEDREVIGNRRMAYEVCRGLPEGVRVILCRMRGLESSIWSKLKPKEWKWRRVVTMHFEDKTEELREWATSLDKRSFNEKLEEWYNQ